MISPPYESCFKQCYSLQQHQLEILQSNDTVFQTIYKKGSGFNETEIRTYLGGFLFSGEEIDLGGKVERVIKSGETVIIQTPGGGGFGSKL